MPVQIFASSAVRRQLSEGVYYVQLEAGAVNLSFDMSSVLEGRVWDVETQCYGFSGVYNGECFGVTKMTTEQSWRYMWDPSWGLAFSDNGGGLFDIDDFAHTCVLACVSPLGVHAIVVVEVLGEGVGAALPAAFGTIVGGEFRAPYISLDSGEGYLLVDNGIPFDVEVAHLPGTIWEYDPAPASLSPQRISCAAWRETQTRIFDWGQRSYNFGEV